MHSRRALVFLLMLLAGGAAHAAADIALLLPQTGRLAKAAEAIRDGFLAAYYQDTAGQPEPPTLHFYDSESVDIVRLVHQAQGDGAGLVIGPLDREQIEQLIRADSLPLPVLALNTSEAGFHPSLYQFALSPEDELRQLADWMREQGVRKPLVLTTADDASLRHARLFQSSWGGDTPLPIVHLDVARKGGITAAVREVVQGKARADAYFLASPALARQVQPALTYYHSAVPLYSLASAWDPTADASGQRDLDGVRVCDLPWMVESLDDAGQHSLYAIAGRPAAGFDRLHAFGADAWTLSREWHALRDQTPLALRTGLIRADNLNRLRRTPTCAEIRNGNALPFRSATTETPETGRGR